MVIGFLKLRVQQATKILSSMSWPYRLVLLFLVLWAVTGMKVKASQDDGSLIMPTAFLLVILSIHWFRPDYEFLRIYFSDHMKICWVEYLLISAPMLVGLALSSHSYLLPIYILALLVFIWLVQPSRRGAGKARGLKFIPATYFEWKSGLRKYYYPMLAFWLIGLFFSFHMAAGILSILIIGLISLGFYDQCESEAMLLAPQASPVGYLLSRIKGLILISGGIYLPHLVLFVVFHPQHWYVIMILTLVTMSYQLYALTIKYAFFEPHSKSGKNTILLSLGALVFVLPFILPAIWVLTIRLYFQSINKLKFYLDDFNQQSDAGL